MNKRWQSNLGYKDLRGNNPTNRFILDPGTKLFFDKYVYPEEAKLILPAEHSKGLCLNRCAAVYTSSSTHMVYLKDMGGLGKTYQASRNELMKLRTNQDATIDVTILGMNMSPVMQKIRKYYSDGEQPQDLVDITNKLKDLRVTLVKLTFNGDIGNIQALWLWDLQYKIPYQDGIENIVCWRHHVMPTLQKEGTEQIRTRDSFNDTPGSLLYSLESLCD